MPTGTIVADDYIDDPNRTVSEVQVALNQSFDYLRSLQAEMAALTSTVLREASVRSVGNSTGNVPDKAVIDARLGTTGNIDPDSFADTGTLISAGGGLTGGGSLAANRTISHLDTSSQGSVNNSGSTFIQGIDLDTYGHVTTIRSAGAPAQSTSAGAVGTYGIFLANSGGMGFGGLISGSALNPSNSEGAPQGVTIYGTWRAMGFVSFSDGNDGKTTLFVRVS